MGLGDEADYAGANTPLLSSNTYRVIFTSIYYYKQLRATMERRWYKEYPSKIIPCRWRGGG